MPYTDVKYHPHHLTTFTLEVDWLPYFIPHGWGNGYIAVPSYSELHGKPYDFLNKIYPLPEQELTFSGLMDVPGERIYNLRWTFGFDTCHAWQTKDNWPRSRVVACIENYARVLQDVMRKQLN